MNLGLFYYKGLILVIFYYYFNVTGTTKICFPCAPSTASLEVLHQSCPQSPAQTPDQRALHSTSGGPFQNTWFLCVHVPTALSVFRIRLPICKTYLWAFILGSSSFADVTSLVSISWYPEILKGESDKNLIKWNFASSISEPPKNHWNSRLLYASVWDHFP